MNPVARNPGAFDINVVADTRLLKKHMARPSGLEDDKPVFFQSIDTDSYNIMPREPLMSRRKNGSRYRGRAMHCFSSVNGYRVPGGVDANAKEGEVATPASVEKIMDGLNFAGIAITGYDLDGDRTREQQGFVSSLGGLNTVMNTGSKAIHPGDRLRVNIPNFGRTNVEDDGGRKGRAQISSKDNFRVPEGVPTDKLLFAIEPVSHSNDTVQKVATGEAGYTYEDISNGSLLKEAVDAMTKKNAGGVVTPDVGKAVTAMLNFCQAEERFTIGKALSYARPGHALDIVLQ